MTDNQVALYAAQAWAQANAKSYYSNSVEFGTDVMNVYQGSDADLSCGRAKALIADKAVSVGAGKEGTHHE